MTYPSRRREAEIHADRIASLTAENERLREAASSPGSKGTNRMTKLTEQEIAEGWQLITGTHPVPDGVMVDVIINNNSCYNYNSRTLGWDLDDPSPITKWRINPEYKAELEEQARAVFPELNWPEKVDPMEAILEAKALKLMKNLELFNTPTLKKLALAALKAGIEMKA